MDAQNQVIISEREKEVLQFLANGLNTKQIAVKLNICEETVRTHRKHILQKINAINCVHLIAKALSLGILQMTENHP